MWEALKQVCTILKPFEEITQIMSGTHYLTASLAIVIVDGLKNVISIMKTKQIYGVAKNFLLKLEDGLEIYFPRHNIEDNMLLGLCTFLDPRFKIHAFLDNASPKDKPTLKTSRHTTRINLIKKHILDLLKINIRKKRSSPAVETILNIPPGTASKCEDIETMSIWGKMDKTIAAITPTVDDIATDAETDSKCEDIDTMSIWGKMDKTIAAITPTVDDIATDAETELEMFINEPVIPRDSSPLVWWKSHAFMYPNLAEIFNEHCHMVVTSVECERVHSKAGNFATQKRAQLSRKRTAELVFLKSNEKYCI
ncbi:unnamed protein product [Leptidea sinapis]|uniref:HAT C-terminal dimerisation domain-containing protein n=1 Tax=Leptidea sinapis TaxID=189913 RepID=A0A5E4Q1M5_9NEOP|nr:unnamed protein product [Leptidea sinapis]